MAALRPERAIDWLLRPWVDRRGFGARAGRIVSVVFALIAVILPCMVLWFGPRGWWWDTTLAVCLACPLGIIVADELTERIARARRASIHGIPRIVALFFGFALGMAAGYVAIYVLHGGTDRPARLLASDYRRNMLVIAPVIFVVVGVGASLWYRAEAYRLEGEAARARYAALEGQLQPHFLFNALNALKELIADDPTRASEFTQELADLYRLILAVGAKTTTTLADELAIVRRYLDVERVRHGDRLRFTIDVHDDLLTRHVPALMLQTLVENAVKHGIGKSRTGGTITIAAAPEDDGTAITITNTGAPYAPRANGGGRGLANTRARLELMYGATSAFTIGPHGDDGTRVRFVVSGETIE